MSEDFRDRSFSHKKEEQEFNGANDIYKDESVLKYLNIKELTHDEILKKRNRILQRAKWFEWEMAKLLMKLLVRWTRMIPKLLEPKNSFSTFTRILVIFASKGPTTYCKTNIDGLIYKQKYNLL